MMDIKFSRFRVMLFAIGKKKYLGARKPATWIDEEARKSLNASSFQLDEWEL